MLPSPYRCDSNQARQLVLQLRDCKISPLRVVVTALENAGSKVSLFDTAGNQVCQQHPAFSFNFDFPGHKPVQPRPGQFQYRYGVKIQPQDYAINTRLETNQSHSISSAYQCNFNLGGFQSLS